MQFNDFQPNIYMEIVEEHKRAGNTWLQAQYKSDLLNKTKSARFAEIVERMNGSSIKAKENAALLDPEWKEFIQGLIEADRQARDSKFALENLRMKFDAMRSANANARKDMGIQSFS